MTRYKVVRGLGVLFLIAGCTLVGGIFLAALMDSSTFRHNSRLAIIGALLVGAGGACLGTAVTRLVCGGMLVVMALSIPQSLRSGMPGEYLVALGVAVPVLMIVLLWPLFAKKGKAVEGDLAERSIVDKLIDRLMQQ